MESAQPSTEGVHTPPVSDLRSRVITGSALAVGFLLMTLSAAAWCGALKILLLVGAVIIGVGAYEMGLLVSGRELEPGGGGRGGIARGVASVSLFLPALFATGALLRDPLCNSVSAPSVHLGGTVLGIVLMLGALSSYSLLGPWKDLAARREWLGDTLMAGAFVGLGGALLIGVTAFGEGAWHLLWLVSVVAMNDIAAYFTGRTLGGPKLAPEVSPKKTWAGACGGLLVGIVVGSAVAPWVGLSRWSLDALTLACLVTVAAQIGDLFKSLLKRSHGVKDMGAILPGHGGVLDRIDGILAGALVLYCELLLRTVL